MTRNKLYKKTPKEFNTLIVFSIIIQKYYSKSGEKAEKCSRVLWLQLPSHTAVTDRKKVPEMLTKGFLCMSVCVKMTFCEACVAVCVHVVSDHVCV